MNFDEVYLSIGEFQYYKHECNIILNVLVVDETN